MVLRLSFKNECYIYSSLLYIHVSIFMKGDSARDSCLADFTRQRSGPVEAFNIAVGSSLRADAISRIAPRPLGHANVALVSPVLN